MDIMADIPMDITIGRIIIMTIVAAVIITMVSELRLA
jgi:hypothetical protein